MDTCWILSANDQIAQSVLENGNAKAADLIEYRGRQGKWYMAKNLDLADGGLVCFYASKTGIVAKAKVNCKPFETSDSKAKNLSHPWEFAISGYKSWLNKPIKLGKGTDPLVSLDMYRESPSNWQRNLRSPSKVSKHDFELLTGEIA